ncbi:MAG: hypothetical protein M3P18_24840 [Actinomycetota bacterium]|nr:hypothetical protein [Actinomycetota bacterium]
MDLNKNARYGTAHKELRRRYVIALDNAGASGIPCSRCSEPIVRGMHFDLDHTDDGDARSYRGIAHRRCNRATSGAGVANTGNGNGRRAKPAEPELCEHMRRGERHGKLCCGNSRDW